jgi:ferredoxin--NADP+ reductase
MNHNKHLVAIVGAGPAGLFAAREMAVQGIEVVLFNRDIKPGGLAEYGIYPEKHRMKEGLRVQFRQVLSLPKVHYYGNVLIGEKADLSLDDLREMGFQAILVAAGAQGIKHLGLPGEDLTGVYHAKELVFHYNRLPPFSGRTFHLGKRVAIIGAGNVCMDIARYLATSRMVDEVVIVIRRGPAEVKFDNKELEHVVTYLDLTAVRNELDRVGTIMRTLGQTPEHFWDFVLLAREKGALATSKTRLSLMFLTSPSRILGDETGQVCGLEVEENDLVRQNDRIKSRGLGKFKVLDVDSVVFAIGDRVDDTIGLPINGNDFFLHPEPRFPLGGESYELLDPHTGQVIEDVFVAGWSRKASNGLVGVAHKDGINGARVVEQYLSTLPGIKEHSLSRIDRQIKALPMPVVSRHELLLLQVAEQTRARQLHMAEFKFPTNEEMLQVIGMSEIR